MSDPNPRPAIQPPGTDEFRFDWREPSDGELTWEWDDMHMPFALAPLAGDYVEVIGHGFAYRYERLELPIDVLARVWNGYAYFAVRSDLPDAANERYADQTVPARRATVPLAGAYWRDRAMPELRELYRWIDEIPVASLPVEQLAEAWDGAWRRIARAWQIHFYAITGPYQVLNDLADLYEAIIPGASPGEALRLIQGTNEALQAVDEGIEQLHQVAAQQPAIRAWLEGAEAPTLESLRALPDGAQLAAELDAFLRLHGHLGAGFDDLSLPTWGDQPSLLLSEVAKRLRQTPVAGASAARRERLLAEADELATAARASLVGDPEQLRKFEETLAFAREIGPITEVHNYWIDRMADATLRRFVRRVGLRLAEMDVIDEADDVLFLHRDEVPALLRRPADRRKQVGERRETHAAQATRTPPRYLGRAPKSGPSGRFDGERLASTGDDRLQGTGASAGRARGPARVTLTPADFARVQPGDIIVCPSSNPSWVPLFAIAGGLVTNTGGVLSHAAVVAREFGLPAVVGTGDATTRIADGRMVEIDGASGEVRLL